MTTKTFREKLVEFCRMRNASEFKSNAAFSSDLTECGLSGDDLPAAKSICTGSGKDQQIVGWVWRFGGDIGFLVEYGEHLWLSDVRPVSFSDLKNQFEDLLKAGRG